MANPCFVKQDVMTVLCLILGFVQKDARTILCLNSCCVEDVMTVLCLNPGFVKKNVMCGPRLYKRGHDGCHVCPRLCEGGCPFLKIWDGCNSIISVFTIEFTVIYYCPLGNI